MGRSSNEVRQLNDLPNWFSLENYKFLKDLNRTGWLIQFESRFFHRKYLKLWESRPRVIAGLMEVIEMLWKNPDATKLDLANNEAWVIPQPPVRATRVEEIYQLWHFLDPGLKEKADSYFLNSDDYNVRYGSLFSRKEESPFQRSVDDFSQLDPLQTHLTVDLRASNKQIFEAFADHIKTIRAERNEFQGMRELGKFDREKWLNSAIIPYLDLEFWSQINEKPIVNRLMADSIFPPGEGGEDTVRKTVSPMAERLMTEAFIDQFKSYVGRYYGKNEDWPFPEK